MSRAIVDPPGQIAPAPLPSYEVGDRYVFDNPREVWTIQSVDGDRITWRSDLGGSRVTPRDPLIPSLRTAAAEVGTIERTIREQTGNLWPLSVGNETSFVVSVAMEGREPQALAWNCRVVGTERVAVPAGTFNTYKVACARSDGLRLNTFHAPTIGYFVRREVTSGDKEQIRSLVAVNNRAANVARAGDAPPPDAAPAAPAEASPLPPPRGTGAPPQAGVLPQDAPRAPVAGPSPSSPPAYSPPAYSPSPMPAPAPTPTRASQPDSAPVAGMTGGGAGWSGYGVRLASYSSSDLARKGWGQFQGSYPGLLGGVGPHVEAVALPGKGTYHRLYAGPFSSAEAARRLCGQIGEMGTTCDVKSFDIAR